MTAMIVVLLLIEFVLLMAWVGGYYRWGLPLFSRRIKVPRAALLDFPFGQLENETTREQWPSLRFHPLSKRSCAFRESMGIHFGWRYPPMMRGLIQIDLQRSEIRVVGWCNWTVLAGALSAIPALAVAPSGVLVVALLCLASYLVQRHRYLCVEEAVRTLATRERLSPLGPARIPLPPRM